MNSCLICAETFNASKHKAVCCQYCDFTACRTCCEYYILDQGATICMNPEKNPDGTPVCQKVWTRKYVVETFTSQWVNTKWRDMLKKDCVDRERSQFPATMAIIAREKEEWERKKGLRDELDALKLSDKKLSKKYERTQKKVDELFNNETKNIKPVEESTMNIFMGRVGNMLDRLDEEAPGGTSNAVILSNEHILNHKNSIIQHQNLIILDALKQKYLYPIRDEIRKNNEDVYRVRGLLKNRAPPSESNATVTHTRKCPDENCRGFLSSQWKCGLCDMWVCPDCHEIKGASRDIEHTCNPDVKATVKLLENDTKPCPKCSTSIHKISGCDHMWCTQCHTSFSWRRGTIINSNANPHYYEWLRQRGANGGEQIARNHGDFECGRDLNDTNLHIFLESSMTNLNSSDLIPTDTVSSKNVLEIVRNSLHLYNIQRRWHEPRDINNSDLRVKYLKGEITEKMFAMLVLKKEKASEKNRDITNVIDLEYQGITDIIFRMVDLLKKVTIPKYNRPSVHELISHVHSNGFPNWSICERNNGERILTNPAGVRNVKNELLTQTYERYLQGSRNIYKKRCMESADWSSNQELANKVVDLYGEFNSLTEYSNTILKEHSKTYKSKLLQIKLLKSDDSTNHVLV